MGHTLIECPHAVRCPGCALIGLAPAEQLEVKGRRLATALAPYAAAGVPEPEGVRAADPVVGYRTRAKFAVAVGGRVGLFAAGTHEVLDLPECRVLAPALARAAQAVRALLASPPPGAAAVFRGVVDDRPMLEEEERAVGRLRAVDLREVHDDVGVGVVMTLVVDDPAPTPPELDAACDALFDSVPHLRVVALSQHDGRSPQLLGRAPVALRGEPLQADRTAPDEPWSYASPGSFAQAHRAQSAAIGREVIRVLSPAPGMRVLDVFAGSGALALAVAARGAHVTLVESFAPAIDAAVQAARRQALEERVSVRVGPAERELPRLAAEGTRFDAAVVNPPRRGVAPAARAALARLSTGPLVYVSCEPETLARDLAHLATLGRRAVRLTPFDLMPQTREVECVAVLERGAPPRPTFVYEDDEVLAVAKPPFLATTAHDERDDSLLARVRAIAPDAVPLQQLDAETSGVCLFARSAAVAAAWQAALASADGRQRYLALVRGRSRHNGRIARPVVERGRRHAAVTRYRRLELAGGHALLEVTPEGARAQQIRRHLASVGHPVLGDERHGHAPSNRHLAERYWLDRPFLHVVSVSLVHPHTSELLHVETPLAPDLAAVLDRLRGSRRPRAPRGSAS